MASIFENGKESDALNIRKVMLSVCIVRDNDDDEASEAFSIYEEHYREEIAKCIHSFSFIRSSAKHWLSAWLNSLN